jgi:hypothetical protein
LQEIQTRLFAFARLYVRIFVLIIGINLRKSGNVTFVSNVGLQHDEGPDHPASS